MDFNIDEDQAAIADMASRLFSEQCDDTRLAAFDRSGEPYDADLWRKVVETGLHALLLDADVGGSGLGMTELMLVLQAQGRALAPVPLWRHQLAAAALAAHGQGEFNARLVAGAAAGEFLATLSMEGAWQSRDLLLRATPCAGGWQLDGTAQAVPLAAQSRWALLAATVDGRARLFAVDLANPAVGFVEGHHTHGESVADIVCTRLALPVEALLPVVAWPWLEQRACAAVAALQLGVSEEQLRRTAEYVGERRQFDRVIATFQAAQMQMADGYIHRETLRSSLMQLCYRIDVGLDAAPQALATKFLASEVGHRVGHMAQHLHGGIGVDTTYPIHRYQLWSRALGLAAGGANSALARLGDWLADNDCLGWKYDLDEPAAA
ncbi:MAG: acyl-CoA/acyl-ACP dehydrogenase [Rhodocyclaceae bacterium]|jgi:alkylation response protein AidB-like acyl-CoA dehydrogenase|nr:acyl-CoA/acyl-ACP dehydrogenase [Rhodocyclaceae bacterium]MBK6553349.1 acyl-CoA/acyl-ACP dehydrogenase [Rhodocyclaceae bacterium]MBK9311496.1 acyl-CoA/acyl-ACP dehydrogenase [Rhodocyclaceae bacterium]